MPQPKPLHVLSLSGGGYRGLFAAEVLHRLEKQIGMKAAESFDLFAGTSVGGLIAAGLALGRSPLELRDAVIKHGPVIFDDRVTIRSRNLFRKPKGHFGGLFRSKYNGRALQAAIDQILGDERGLRVADVPQPLLLVATCATTKAPFLMSNMRPGTPGSELRLRDALRATSAAPGYFPAVDLDFRTLLDGGLVANAPELIAAAELADIRAAGPADLRILSIGTAAPDAGESPQPVGRRGLIKWLRGDLVPLTLDAQEKLASAQARALFGRNYIRINASPAAAQREVLALDLATPEATRTLLLLAEEAVTVATADRVKGLLSTR